MRVTNDVVFQGAWVLAVYAWILFWFRVTFTSIQLCPPGRIFVGAISATEMAALVWAWIDSVSRAQLKGGWDVVASWVAPILALAVLASCTVVWSRKLKRAMRMQEVAAVLPKGHARRRRCAL